MRLWLQNFVSIQPRTRLEKSDVSWPADITLGAQEEHECCVGWAPAGHAHGGRGRARGPAVTSPLSATSSSPRSRLAVFYRSLEGSFSAGSTATIATKYSFFQVFRDLQNYLDKFSKILQKKISDFRISHHFRAKKIKSGNFAEICKSFLWFLAKFCNCFKKSAR